MHLQKNLTSLKARYWIWLTLGYGAIWAFVNLPALTEAWWYIDDFWLMEQPIGSSLWWRFANEAGRPVTTFLFMLQVFERTPNDVVGNILVRWMQGGLHVISAVVIVAILQRYARFWVAVVSVMPFLLWGFNGEATLWFGGIQHVVGLLFVVFGLLWIQLGVSKGKIGWSVGGGVLCALSILTNQVPASGGIFLWLVTIALRWVERERFFASPESDESPKSVRFSIHPQIRNILLEGIYLVVGLGTGAVISLIMVKVSGYGRGDMAIDLHNKFLYYVHVNKVLFFWPQFYPQSLKLAGAGLLVLFIMALVYAAVKSCVSKWALFFSLFVVACGTFILHLANLIISMNWPSMRVLYISPLLICAILILCLTLFHKRLLGIGITLFILAVIVVNYGIISYQNAQDFISVYQGDLDTLAQIEDFAQQNNVTNVLVIPKDRVKNVMHYNPYQCQYNYLDAHRSDFHTPWSPHPFIRTHSEVLNTWPDNRATLEQPELLAWGALNKARQHYAEMAPQRPQSDGPFVCMLAPDRSDLILVYPQ